MEPTELIRYRRALKRKNYSAHTVKNYVNILDHFMRWLTVPLSEVTPKEIASTWIIFCGGDEDPKRLSAICKRSVSSSII